MEHCGAWWNVMEHGGTLQNMMEHDGTWQNTMEHDRKSWNIPELHSRTSWNSHETGQIMMETCGSRQNSLEYFQNRKWKKKELQNSLEHSFLTFSIY